METTMASRARASGVATHDDGLQSHYALERSVIAWSVRAAGAQTIIAPAARRPRWRAAAQRGR